MPETVVNEMNGRGFDMGSASAVQTAVPGTRWKFTLDLDGKPREFEVRLEPEVWEKSGKDSIRFIKSLEQMWIYR
jgi:hypothetical protein